MKANDWKKKVIAACEEAGTYRPFFDSAIETLASILEMRDDIKKQYEEIGTAVVEHTNSHGATNRAKNPAYAMLMDCNAQALAYWRDLGLTPAGYKRLNAEVVKEEPKGSLETLLEKIT